MQQKNGMCFQVNAFCDEPIMIQWVRCHWEPHVEGPAMLLLVQHKAKMPTMKVYLLNTTQPLC